MKALIKHNFFTDGSHGWLKVSKKRLDKLNILDKITSCSFMRGDYVYLEEDCDLSTYIEGLLLLKGIERNSEAYNAFMKEFWSKTTINDTSDSRNGSIIRTYENYKNYSDAEQQEKNKLIDLLLNHKRWDKKGINTIKNGSFDDLLYWKKYYSL